MLKLASKLPRALGSHRNITLFSSLLPTQNIPLVFPFHSNVVEDCGVPLLINNNLNFSFSLKDSFIPFHGTTSHYHLTPKTFNLFDKKITHLANIVELIGENSFKIISMLGLKFAMEVFPMLFSWQEYYAISEYTAVVLLNHGYADRAINLIKLTPTIAMHAYRTDIGKVDPLFRSVNELLILAYLLRGDHQQAENLAERLLKNVQEPAIKSYQARALTIKALTHYIQGNYSQGICLQEQAVELLKGPRNTALQAVALYDLWVFHRMLNQNTQAEEVTRTLDALLTVMNDPLMEPIKSFIIQQLDKHKHQPLTTPILGR